MRTLARVMVFGAMVGLSMGALGCKPDGPAENLGEKIDDAADQVEDAADNVAD